MTSVSYSESGSKIITPGYEITACSFSSCYGSSVHLITLPMREIAAPITGKSGIPRYPALDFLILETQRDDLHAQFAASGRIRSGNLSVYVVSPFAGSVFNVT